MTPNKDSYGEIINGEDTYRAIAWDLKDNVPIIIGWTDELGTHYDILFTRTANSLGGQIQGGIRQTDLFVSIMRKGAFGFDIEHTDTAPGYYGEKLSIQGTETNEKLADLINGVKRYLME